MKTPKTKKLSYFDKPQMLLCVFWTPADEENIGTRFGEVSMHVGDILDPPLTHDEMQHIAFAAKMEFARQIRKRKHSTLKRKK